MKMRVLYGFVLICVLSSCAMNKLFLYPYPLTDESKFSSYLEEAKDTVTLSFEAGGHPLIYNSAHEQADLPYVLEHHKYISTSENEIYAWIFKPKENYNGITLYFLHGNGGNVAYHYGFAAPFVKAGFQVFMIDYSGFGFSEGESTRKNVLKDANSGIDYLINNKEIKYDKVLIYGQSLGGHLAAVVAAQNQDKIDGVVIEGGFSSHKDVAAERVPILARIFVREMYSGKKNISKFLKPTLIIHSKEDETVKYKNGLRMYKAATEPKELYSIENRHIRGPIFYTDSIVYKMKEMVK